jgi:uncharacterized protein
MNTSLNHLSQAKICQLNTLIPVLVRKARPEKIILFGVYASPTGGLDHDTAEAFPVFLSGFDLLIVTRSNERRYDYEMQDILENSCRIHTPVTIIVHDIKYVNTQLEEGQYFFAMMFYEAILLYDAGHTPLTVPGKPDLVRIREIAKKDFQVWSERAKAFFRTAQFNCEQKEHKISAFLLHQAAEHIYQAILLAFAGYKPCTHNLDKLRRYTSRYSFELAYLFPRNTTAEDQLFKLLTTAYVDARYKPDYLIADHELQTLIDRVDKLLAIASRICNNRFLSLTKMAIAMSTEQTGAYPSKNIV